MNARQWPAPLPAPATGRSRRRALKRIMYSQLTARDGVQILFGREQPTLHFQVMASPPSIYINYPIRRQAAAAFRRHINLADGFSPCPMACLDGDTPRLMLTLNIYNVSGLVEGTRAEWSTYVKDENGVPRYMVLEARAANGSLDPVNLFTRPDDVTHALTGSRLRCSVVSGDQARFECQINLRKNQRKATPAAAWIAANDYIYWRNGICDKTWYDSSLAAASVRVVPLADQSISDETHWANFTEAEPINVLRYESGIDFMIAPWFNL